MLKFKPGVNQLLTVVAVSASLSACGGGGGGGSSDGGDQPAAVQTGQLIDSAIEGVAYQTGSLSGFTNTEGQFQYRAGERITFSIGGIQLNAGVEPVAGGILTPVELTSSDAPGEAKAINLMQLLQSLDDDGNPDNGIKITESVRNNAQNTTLDFNSPAFANEVINAVAELTEGTGVVVDPDDALSHFYETVMQLREDGNTNLPDTKGLVLPEFTQVAYIQPVSDEETGAIQTVLTLPPGSAKVTIQLDEGEEVNMDFSEDRKTWLHQYHLAAGADVDVVVRLKSKNGMLLGHHTQPLTGAVLDTDNDGVPDNQDAFPEDPNETQDSDQDGIGNNADTDDDNDDIADTSDRYPLDSNIVIWPVNDDGLSGALRDTHGDKLKVAGTLEIKAPKEASDIHSYEIFWADPDSEVIQGGVLKTLLVENASDKFLLMDLTEPLTMPDADSQLKLVANNTQGADLMSTMIRFHDFTGNVNVSGKGGNLITNWEYGVDRDHLSAYRENIAGTDYCYFDNGLVMVVDMKNEFDNRSEHTKDDVLYPAFNFDCSESLVNNQYTVYKQDQDTGEDIVSTYSALNDAFFYGKVTFDAFFKYLGRPPVDDKWRLRVHYGDEFGGVGAFWNGSYANFGDNKLFSYGNASLDIVAHELGHGFLFHNSQLSPDTADFTKDALTMHEAFSDMTGVAVKHFYTGQLDWLHGKEVDTPLLRDGSKIITHEGAIPSYFDYEQAGVNQYLRIGMLSYPFYLLTNQWGIERSYPLFLEAAQTCWQPNMSLPDGAQCVLDAATQLDEPQADVIEAFRAVKIKLYDEGSMAHFRFTPKKETISFNADSSVTTREITQWHWDFDDGSTSNEQHPVYEYAQGGIYNPTLTITDNQGQTDTFTRPIDVFSGYCPPVGISNADRVMSRVTINNQHVINSGDDPERYDYTQLIIPIEDANNISIKVEGENGNDNSIDWRMWLDANDDGIFDNSPGSSEIVHDSGSPQGSAYELETDIQIPVGSDPGPLRLRLAGQLSVTSSCNLQLKTTVDVLIQAE
ncbi:PKD domain-containing protein [Litoribacillus peritrichatus]|uniref:PKD domain-containing protein n=1 Tax=Litoribacillus peritrichatus TaxID=718191 RepID=A0ABP7MTZ9_9GAMM